MARIRLHTATIHDWPSFHRECQRALGFPAFYGANMNAWIDCLSDLREETGMVAVRLGPTEVLELELPAVAALGERVPDLVDALRECTAFVNRRYAEMGEPPALVLIVS